MLLRASRHGSIVSFTGEQTSRTAADGLRTQSVGALNFAHMQAYVDDIVTVTEDEIRETMRRTIFATRLVPEPSGAVALAAVLFHREQLPPAQQTVAIMSGGNVEPSVLRSVLDESRGVEKCVARELMFGCPILRAFCEGWDKQKVRGKSLGCRAVVSHPSQETRRMGHPNISSHARETSGVEKRRHLGRLSWQRILEQKCVPHASPFLRSSCSQSRRLQRQNPQLPATAPKPP